MVWMLLVLYFMEDVGDLVGVVDGVDVGAALFELVVSACLDGSGVLAGGFGFDECDVSAGEDDDAVWDSCGAWAGEFPAESAVFAYLVDEVLFEFLFECHCGVFLVGWDKVGAVFKTVADLGVLGCFYPLIPYLGSFTKTLSRLSQW